MKSHIETAQVSIFLGIIFGAQLGSFFKLSLNEFYTLKSIAVAIASAGLLWSRARCPLWFLAATIWLTIHSPANWQSGVSGRVIKSNGCGLVRDDLLVVSDNLIWRSRANAVSGDQMVVRYNKGFENMGNSAVVIVPAAEDSIICLVAADLRHFLLKLLDGWPAGEREWLQSFVLGADLELDSVTVSAFRNLGLLHIVVLSGGHICILSSFALLSFRLIPSLFYSMRILTMQSWPLVWSITFIWGVASVLFFSLVTGLTQSVQRALLSFISVQMLRRFLSVTIDWRILLFIWSLQCLIFPINIFSLSMLLSWCGSLILIACFDSALSANWLVNSWRHVQAQCLFAMTSALSFGTISFLSVFANLLLVPIFSTFLTLNLFVLMFGPDYEATRVIVIGQMKLLDTIRTMAAWQKTHAWMTVRIDSEYTISENIGRNLMALLFVFLFVKIAQKNRRA